ncbi:MAG: hypothetical protein H6Q20_783 [Bacteroidetes bacterium]|nr:hypothetical protein [Bacteroidota bacterium]
MTFRTVVNTGFCTDTVSHQDHLLTLGSCFSDNIGIKLQNALFSVDVNPFGVLFNPVSIANSVEILLKKDLFTEKQLFRNGSLWSSFSHSTLFSATTPEQALLNINSRLNISIANLSDTNYLLVTFGTAWVYEDTEHHNHVVSNCHKLPANRFNRRRLSVGEIVDLWSKLIDKLKVEMPALKIIFTVSPVRHWKDGAQENNLSKSTLLLAVDNLTKNFQQVHYFPAYEIQMDELRDYRFYSSDMLHPSDVAVDYIWEKFANTFFSADTCLIKNKAEQLTKALNHRPLHAGTAEYDNFLRQIETQKETLFQIYPFLKNRI